MKLAYSNLSPFLPNLKHNCCLAHILNLIGEAWVNFQKFELEHLLQNGIESPTLAPLLVKTSKRLINDLEFFKIRNKAIAPFVYSRIVSLQAFLSSGTRNPPISNEIFQLLNEENQDIASFVSLFSRAFILANEKCEKHISHHPALLFFKAIQCFDPRFIQSNSSNHNMENYRIIKEFYLPTDTLIQEWAIYCGLNESIEEFDDLDLYWRGKRHILPELSSLALIYIWLPVSGVDIERSFSSYKSIFQIEDNNDDYNNELMIYE
ncbi:hypothetical protein GLOIN_2v1761741 [Rhizophagus irregularis DAOM 181602=DAOM 197198]|nr:hypothetical protein GLOIN_2v1761741 [Rhizophagus irregularis DAOM 181602=DAOM 197198]